MKKALSILLALCMVFALCACGGNNSDAVEAATAAAQAAASAAEAAAAAAQAAASAAGSAAGTGAAAAPAAAAAAPSGEPAGQASGEPAAPAAAQPAAPAANTGDLTFGWSVYDLSNPFFIPMDQGVQDKCAELGVKLLPTHDEKGDATEMITGVQALINQGIDALVISPFSPESMSAVMAMADDAGIPVIVVDIGTGGANVDAFIRSDMYGGGQLAGQYFLDSVGAAGGASGGSGEAAPTSKNVAIIKCETSATYAITRGEGFKDVVTKAGYTVVDEQHGDSSKDKAYGIMVDYLAKYGTDLAAVFCENDQMALGAAAAIDERGLTGQILVYGFDGNDDAIAAIKEGTMAGTVAQDPYGMGQLGVELAYQAVSGTALVGDETDADGNQTFLAPVKMIGSTGEEVDVVVK